MFAGDGQVQHSIDESGPQTRVPPGDRRGGYGAACSALPRLAMSLPQSPVPPIDNKVLPRSPEVLQPTWAQMRGLGNNTMESCL
jgi:hypothetical protein